MKSEHYNEVDGYDDDDGDVDDDDDEDDDNDGDDDDDNDGDDDDFDNTNAKGIASVQYRYIIFSVIKNSSLSRDKTWMDGWMDEGREDRKKKWNERKRNQVASREMLDMIYCFISVCALCIISALLCFVFWNNVENAPFTFLMRASNFEKKIYF